MRRLTKAVLFKKFPSNCNLNRSPRVQPIKYLNLKTMQNPDKKNVQLNQVADLMNTLADMQLKMSRVKAMFPNYHQQLQHTYNQLIIQARRNNVLPPWMTA